jgi:hypothetical protein
MLLSENEKRRRSKKKQKREKEKETFYLLLLVPWAMPILYQVIVVLKESGKHSR